MTAILTMKLDALTFGDLRVLVERAARLGAGADTLVHHDGVVLGVPVPVAVHKEPVVARPVKAAATAPKGRMRRRR